MGAKIKLADDIVNGRVPEDRRKRTRAENPVTVVRRLLVQDALEAKDNEGEYVHNNANSVRRALLPELDEVDVRTIQRDMVFLGAKNVVRPRTAALNPERMAQRMSLIPRLKRLNHKKIWFSDESLFDCSDNQLRQWVRNGEDPTPLRVCSWTAQVHCWAFIGYGARELVFLGTDRVNAASYVETLEQFMLPEYKKHRNVWWMHDNAPAHSAFETATWLEENRVKTVTWPPYSPDLNPIENLWSIIKRQVDVKGCTTREVLIERITEVWFSLKDEEIEELIDSFPRRLNSRGPLRRTETIVIYERDIEQT